MDIVTITFVTACTALISAIAGPVVTARAATRQIRATVISGNRERWIEALRDSLAEFSAIALSAAMLQEALGRQPLEALRVDPKLATLVERAAVERTRIHLMLDPDTPAHARLGDALEACVAMLFDGEGTRARMEELGGEITAAGRAVIRAGWIRVKRGD